MKKLTGFTLAIGLIFIALPVTLADSHEDGDVKLQPFGYLHVRPEFNRNLTDVDAASDDEFGYAVWRARLGMNAMFTRDVTLTLDVQALGRFGDSIPFRGFHGVSTGDSDVQLFQGYVDMANIRDTNFSLRFGRQTMVLGDEWLVGDSEFYGGTSFDAIRLDYAYGDGHNLTGFWSKIVETDVLVPTISVDGGFAPQPDGSVAFDSGADDVDLVGLWNTLALEEDQTLDTYLLRLDHRLPETQNITEMFSNTEDRWTLGVRYNRPKGEGWDFNVNAAYQFGDIFVSGADTGADIRAYAAEVESGWSFVRANNLVNRVRIFAATYTGEDDEDDDTNRGFSVLFQERHGRYGIADLFTGVFLPNLTTAISGLDIWGAGFDAQLGERWSLGGNAIASNVAKNPLVVNPSVAYEGNIYVHLDYNDNLSFDVGFAQVFARSFFIDNPAFGSDQNPSRIYVHAVAKF